MVLKHSTIWLTVQVVFVVSFVMAGIPITASQELTPLEQLGKFIFFDTNLSIPPKQSCASCHGPEVGFSGPDSFLNQTYGVYHGSMKNRFGNRKPPAAAYAGASPVLYYDENRTMMGRMMCKCQAGDPNCTCGDEGMNCNGGGMGGGGMGGGGMGGGGMGGGGMQGMRGFWVGGMFWDGRATGWTLGDPLAEQAMGPFLNPVEQNMPQAKSVCIKVAHSGYAGLFEQVWGPGSLDYQRDVQGTYERIARSIAAYERSHEVNPFTSKYDYYLAGKVQLTQMERMGLTIFNNKGKCSTCHPSQRGPQGEPPLFTDFTYHNLGIPKNPNNPFYSMPPQFNPAGADWIDEGLGGFLKSAGMEQNVYRREMGKHKVPSLRNINKRPYPNFVKSFGHNGFFKSIHEIVHFYNTREVPSENWPAPEFPCHIIGGPVMGNLGLEPAEGMALIAFLGTLDDGYIPGIN